MAGKGRAVRMAVLYGPMVAEAARKYGPAVWDQLKTQREPVEKLVQSKAARGNQRKKALAHAATLVNGSVIQVFHRNDPHWVVFSGEEPIAVHPQTTEPFEELLRNVDLATRIVPPRRPAPPARRGRRAAGPTRSAGASTGPTDTGTDGPAPPSRAQMPVIRPEEH